MNPLKDKNICLVMTCNRPYYVKRREEHKDTFEFFKSAGFSVVYLHGNSQETRLEDITENEYNLHVPITDCYELLSPKMEYAFNYLNANGCKGILKIDDDISILDKAVANFVVENIFPQCDYMGIDVGYFGMKNPLPVEINKFNINFFKTMQTVIKENFSYYQGPFYWISRAALEEVCKMGMMYFYEDAAVGYAIFKSDNLKVLDFNSVANGDLSILSKVVFRVDDLNKA